MTTARTTVYEKADQTHLVKIPGLRWWVAAMLFGAAVLNYVDRQTLSLLAPTMQRDLKMDDQAYANVLNMFLGAYVLSYLFSGRIADRLGAKASYALFISGWFLADMLTSLVRSAASLGACRALLGLGEAGNWTVSPKVVGEWFQPRERAVAIGIYTMGATVGATLAPLVIVPIATAYGWRSAFFATGTLGLIWLLVWLWFYRPPHEHSWMTKLERETMIPAETEKIVAIGTIPQVGVWRRKEIWMLMLARMLTDPVWYFYQFWFAKYLFSARGLSQHELTLTWVIFLAADIGSLAGGWISGQFIRQGLSPVTGRMWTMFGCACCMPLAPLVAFAGSTSLSLFFASIIVFAHLAWLVNLSALVLDIFPKTVVATVFGVVAAGSALGGMAMNQLVSWLIVHHSYTGWFLLTAFLHPAAWLLLRQTRLSPHD